jgi:hypothetical protein
MRGASAWSRHPLFLPLVCLALGFGSRAALIGAVPSNYSFDGFQRWAGRSHLLVQDWLPLTQSILVGNEALGGDLSSARLGLALVAALGMAMAAVLVRRLGGSLAGWCFVPLSLFGPALCWTVVPYQEGTYLALFMSGLALSLAAREDPEKKGLRLAADLVIGATALCRTEGWLLVVLYMVWWRDKTSLRSLWGVLLWLGWKWGIGLEPYRPSPVSYADWEGLGERFDWVLLTESLVKHGRHWVSSGGWILWPGGLAGAWWLFKHSEAGGARRWGVSLVWVALVAQLGSTVLWMVGLETATVRMTLLPGIMLAVLSAVALGAVLPRLPRLARALGVFSLCSLGLYFAADGWIAAHHASRMVRWERVVVLRMEQCPDCYFQIEPRVDLGTRARHDGCEIIQGISNWHHPEDFHCQSWPEEPIRAPTHRSWWDSGYAQEELKSP